MIPKVIHYCWFGGAELPETAKRCIESWKKYCPDYEIVRWDESNFDLQCNDYVKEAYKAKKWSYVTDVARIKILYENGGIYLDTDVELIKPLDSLLNCKAFAGAERVGVKRAVNTGLGYGAILHLPALKGLLEKFDNEPYDSEVPAIFRIVGTYMNEHGFEQKDTVQQVGDFTVYPWEYFGPVDSTTMKRSITQNTYSIHWYSGSWISDKKRRDTELRVKCCKLFGRTIGLRVHGHLSAINSEGFGRYVARHLKP